MPHPAPSFTHATFRRKRLGFTLLELSMTTAIVAILASLGFATYRLYVLKAQTAQFLVDYDHLKTVLAVRTQADSETHLERDSTTGAVPPALTGSLSTTEFNGQDGITFQLIDAPAGTFASYPNQDVYALIATAGNAAAVLRLRVLRSILPFSDGDKVWLQSSADASSAQLTYPIGISLPAVAALVTPPPPSPPSPPSPPPLPPSPPKPTTGTGGSTITGEGTNNGGTWTAAVHICVSSANGGPLTGQDNTSVIYQVVTPYATFQENFKIDPATGCVDHSYGGLPMGGNFHVEILSVVDYNPPTNGSASPLWDGAKPSFNLALP